MIFDDGAFRDNVSDFFGVSAADSYQRGYKRGFKQKSRDGFSIFGSKTGPKAESHHEYELKRGFEDGRAARRMQWEDETIEDSDLGS